MHEFVMAQTILNKLLERAIAKKLKHLSYARISIGETLVHDQTELEELFIQMSKGTPAEGINLDINIVPLKAICKKCKADFDMQTGKIECANCGSRNIDIVQGNEMNIEELF